MKKHGLTIGLILVLIIGLSLLLYPTVSELWNSVHRSAAIASYMGEVADMDDATYRKVLASADEYNARLAKSGNIWVPDEDRLKIYRNQLNVSHTGIMGYIDIPAIHCRLPIYHGADKAVLQIAVGHIEGSSLPVGGMSTHCVLSGHRGLPSAKLFTDLDKLSIGDIFKIYVLDETLAYKIEKILVVKPYEIDELKIETGKDLCTLVTCTPYGVNTHRILVKGRRIQSAENTNTVRVSADAVLQDPMFAALSAVLIFLPVLLPVWIIPAVKRKRAQRND